MFASENGSQDQGPPDGEESPLDGTRDENPDDVSPRDKKPSPSTSPTTSPETSDDELDQFHKELYHLCINKADDNGMILASQALKQKVIDLLGIGARELVHFKRFGPVLIMNLLLSQVKAYDKLRVHAMGIPKTLMDERRNILHFTMRNMMWSI